MAKRHSGQSPDDRGWATYVQSHLDSLGWTNSELSRAAGIDRSLVGRWLTGETKDPSSESIRSVCRALRRDIREGLIAAGLFTRDEMKVTSPAEPDLLTVGSDELLAEVRRRMGARLRTGVPTDSDVAETHEQTDVDTGETHENPTSVTRPPKRSRAVGVAGP